MHRNSLSVALLAFALVGLSGCVSGAQLQEQAEYVAEHAERTHDAALRCDAEREIALAESNLEFLHYEMLRGKYIPAHRHMLVAIENINLVRQRVDNRPECFGIAIVTDADGDGLEDVIDNCPLTPNPTQSNIDGDGLGDACDDDMDGDGILNEPDNCLTVPNADQRDSDGDGRGDACSDDLDGDGIPNDTDRCPEVPEDRDGWEDADGCPEPDNDSDGLLDAVDACPNRAEDFDGWEDEDGCPDVDNDGDGIFDSVDQCPLEPEDLDGDRDADGCPEDSLVNVLDDILEITQSVNFELNSARIVGDISFAILDEVASILADRTDMRLRIEGHTDSQGSSSYNRELSQSRSDSVRAYLVERGISGSRLSASGLGEDRPIATNDTASGRAENRRVEFHILND